MIIYLIDFGLMKLYKDSNGSHIPFREKGKFVGTARYASISNHQGTEQSRKDDLEAICYIMIYLLKGSLPWQRLQAKNKKEKYSKILESKLNCSDKNLCQGLPSKEFE